MASAPLAAADASKMIVGRKRFPETRKKCCEASRNGSRSLPASWAIDSLRGLRRGAARAKASGRERFGLPISKRIAGRPHAPFGTGGGGAEGGGGADGVERAECERCGAGRRESGTVEWWSADTRCRHAVRSAMTRRRSHAAQGRPRGWAARMPTLSQLYSRKSKLGTLQ